MTIMIRINPATPAPTAIGTIDTASVMPGGTPWLDVELLLFDDVCLEVIVGVVVVMNAEKKNVNRPAQRCDRVEQRRLGQVCANLLMLL